MDASSSPLVPSNTTRHQISSSSSSSSWRSRSRRKKHDHEEEDEDEFGQEEEEGLLPGLPDHLAQLCLSRLPPSLLFSVSRSWRRLLYSPSFPPFLSLYVLLSNNNNNNNDSSDHDDSVIEFASFDPISSTWTPLPPPPMVMEKNSSSSSNPILLRHPSFISRQLPVQTVSVAGRFLLLLAGTDSRLLPALPRPLLFDPATARWTLAPPLSSPRRWCAAGSAGGRVYVASGVGSDFTSDTARSAERWEPDDESSSSSSSSRWDPICPLRDSRFSREPMDMVCSDGGRKLCMVSVKTKEGAAYDVEEDRWEDVPAGLVAGWTGPAGGDGTGGGPIYVVDEGVGSVRRYDWGSDKWTDVMVSEEKLKGAASASIAVGGGRICIGGCCCKGSGGGGGGPTIMIVEEEEGEGRTRRSWELSPPAGKRVMAMHVLPRMNRRL